MLGILDVGGGMRDIYGCGVFDWLMDRKIRIPYALGVSAGSANAASYLSGQRGRNYRFYVGYSQRKEYLGLYAFLKTGSFFNLDYIYSGLADEGAEDPIDMRALKENPARFVIAATDAETGVPVYFTKDDLHQNEMTVIKASCAIPIVCRPVCYRGRAYVDGGVSDPIPYRKAFSDGCTHLLVILTHPLDCVLPPRRFRVLYHNLLRRYPRVAEALDRMRSRYDRQKEALQALEEEGKATILAPRETFGVGTGTRTPRELTALYEAGYADAERRLSSRNIFSVL